MRKATLIFLISLLTILVLMPSVNAFFTKSHLYWSLRGLEDVSSGVTSTCGEYQAQVLDGNTATDVPVLHYFDEKFMSYISTHTRGSGYWACLEAAPADDPEQRCLCVGVGLHIVQDTFAHTKGGLVPKYLKQAAMANLFGHMVIEQDFETKHMQYLEDQKDSIVLSGELDYYDEHVLCTFMEAKPNQDGVIVCPNAQGDPKYAQLLEKMSGINMLNDLNIFHSGYLGNGFYDTVYNEKIKLPFWARALGYGLLILGLLIPLFVGITGLNKWRWVIVFEFFLLLAVPGALVIGSFAMHNTWQVTEFIISIPPKFGMLSVSDQDIVDYNNKVQLATNEFLSNGGKLGSRYDDATGLTYIDRDGVLQKGALTEAEKMFKFGLFPAIVLVFLLINGFFFMKTYELSFRKK